MYPNHANSSVTFKSDNLNNTFHEIIISDLTGRLLLLFVKNDSEMTLDISNFPNGVYFNKIKENNNAIKTGKLIVIR